MRSCHPPRLSCLPRRRSAHSKSVENSVRESSARRRQRRGPRRAHATTQSSATTNLKVRTRDRLLLCTASPLVGVVAVLAEMAAENASAVEAPRSELETKLLTVLGSPSGACSLHVWCFLLFLAHLLFSL